MNKEPISSIEQNDKSSQEREGGSPRPHSRRAFLKGVGAATVTVPIAAIAARATAKTIERIPDVLSDKKAENWTSRIVPDMHSASASMRRRMIPR